MKKYLDKETIIVLVIALAILIGWAVWYPKYQREENARIKEQQLLAQAEALKAQKKVQTVPQDTQKPTVKQTSSAASDRKEKSAAKVLKVSKIKKYNNVTLSNKVAAFTINPNTVSVIKVELSQYKTTDRKKSIVFDSSKAPYATYMIEGLEDWTLSNLQVTGPQKTNDTAVLSIVRTFSKGKDLLSVTQLIALPQDSYRLETRMILLNTGKTGITIPQLKVWDTGIAPMKYFGGDKLYSPMHRLDFCPHDSQAMASIDPSVKEEKFQKAACEVAVDWVGSTNKYFASLLFSNPCFNGGTAVKRIPYPMPEKSTDFYYVPSIAGIYKNIEIPAGTMKEYTFWYFAGPKTLAEVKKLPESAIAILHISSFSWMEYLARPVLSLLNFLKGWTGSYGIAIILLTLIVRIVFFPLTERGNRSMRKMSKIAPKAKEIREKFKDNPQLMNQKTMELYREEGVNPVGGCLPILLQIPVFFALYAALDSAVELRHVSFLWATDLTKPDLVGPQFLFGYGIHPLVLLMTALMVLQQKMTPSNMDPSQQKMMMLMPVIMLVVLYNLPSGLTLYWTVSQIFSILQMKYSLYAAKRDEEKAASLPNK